MINPPGWNRKVRESHFTHRPVSCIEYIDNSLIIYRVNEERTDGSENGRRRKKSGRKGKSEARPRVEEKSVTKVNKKNPSWHRPSERIRREDSPGESS